LFPVRPAGGHAPGPDRRARRDPPTEIGGALRSLFAPAPRAEPRLFQELTAEDIMTDIQVAKALAGLDAAIAAATTPEPIGSARQPLAKAAVGAKLFTVMRVDFEKDVAARVHTSDPVSYAVSGTKPINRTHWFDIVHVERRPFVANTIAEIAEVFPDHET